MPRPDPFALMDAKIQRRSNQQPATKINTAAESIKSNSGRPDPFALMDAKISSKDIPSSTQISNSLKQSTSSEPGLFSTAGKSLARGAVNLPFIPLEAADLAQRAGKGASNFVLGKMNIKPVESKPTLVSKTLGVKDKIMDKSSISRLGKNYKSSGDALKDPLFWADNAPESVLSFLVPMGAASAAVKSTKGIAAVKALKNATTTAEKIAAGKALTKIAGGASLTGSMSLEGAAAHEQYRKFEQENPESATVMGDLIASVGTGVVAGGLEGWANFKLFKPVFNKFFGSGSKKVAGKFWKRFLKEAPKTALTEGTTEGLQEVVSNSFAKMGYDDNAELTQGVVEAMALGGAMGGLFGGASSVNFKSNKKVDKKTGLLDLTDEKIPSDVEAFGDPKKEEVINTIVNQLSDGKISPDQISEIANNPEQLQSLGVDADTIHEALQFHEDLQNEKEIDNILSPDQSKVTEQVDEIIKDVPEQNIISTDPIILNDLSSKEDAVGALQNELNRYTGDKGEQINISVSNKKNKTVDNLANIFGKKVTYFKSDSPLAPDGIRSQDNPNHIFLDENSEKPHLFVVGHEIAHTLETDEKDAYDTLVDFSLDYMKNNESKRYKEFLNKQKSRETGNQTEVTDDELHKELLADFMGREWTRTGYWESLYEKDQTTFHKVISSIKGMIKRISEKFIATNQESDEMFTDLVAMRDAFNKVVLKRVGPTEAVDSLSSSKIETGDIKIDPETGDSIIPLGKLGKDNETIASVGVKEDTKDVVITSIGRAGAKRTLPDGSVIEETSSINKGVPTKAVKQLQQYAQNKGKRLVIKNTNKEDHAYWQGKLGFNKLGTDSVFFPDQQVGDGENEQLIKNKQQDALKDLEKGKPTETREKAQGAKVPEKPRKASRTQAGPSPVDASSGFDPETSSLRTKVWEYARKELKQKSPKLETRKDIYDYINAPIDEDLKNELRLSRKKWLEGSPIIESTGPQFSRKESPFYSRLENLITDFNVEKQPASAWKSTFDSWKKKKLPPALQEELEWSGLSEALELSGKQKMTKDEVLGILQGGGVKVEEKLLTSDNLFNKTAKNKVEHPTNTLPGGENYKELLITLPQINSSLDKDAMKVFGVPFLDLNQEQLKMLSSELSDKSGGFSGPHFQGNDNILAWIRFDERVDSEGNKVLFVNEIQSDWANRARNQGIKDKIPTDAEIIRFFDLNDSANPADYVEEMMGHSDFKKGVNDAPFIKSDTAWSMLGLKRAIKYAADNGFDKVAWPGTAEQIYEIEGWGEVIKEDSYLVEVKMEGEWVNGGNFETIEEAEEIANGEKSKTRITPEKGAYLNQDGHGDVSPIVNRYLKDLPRNANRFLKSQMKSKVTKSQLKESADVIINKDQAISMFDGGDTIFLGGDIAESKQEILEFNSEDITYVDENNPINSIDISDIKDQVVDKGVPQFSRKLNHLDPDSEVQQQLDDSSGLNLNKKTDWNLKSLYKESTRTFPHIKPNEHGQFKNIMRVLRDNNNFASNEAWRHVYNNVGNMSESEEKVFTMNLVLDDMFRDATPNHEGMTLLDGEDGYPFGYKSLDDIKKSISHFQTEAKKSPLVMKALANRRNMMYSIQNDLVDAGLLSDAVKHNRAFFHHQVLDKMSLEERYTFGKRSAVSSKKKGWQKGRKGSSLNYNIDYLESEFEVVSQALASLEMDKSKKRIKGIYDKSPEMKRRAKVAGETGDGSTSWRDYLPEGHVFWKPDPGSSWFKALTVPEKVYLKIMDGGEVDASEFRSILAKGADVEWAIPTEIADTLDEEGKIHQDPESIAKLSSEVVTAWKKWTLMNPLRVMRYNINNISGDLDIAIAYDWKILPYMKQSMKDLAGDLNSMGRKLPFNSQKYGTKITDELKEELKEAHKQGVIGSGFVVHEIADVTSEFNSMINSTGNPAKLYWERAKEATNYRENILRLAAYRYFKDKLNKGESGVYGASNPSEIDSIKNIDERAAKLSRELVGDYGGLTQSGKWLRKHMIPFYSWMEINLPRYVRLMKNVKYEGGKINLGSSVVWRGSKVASKFMAMSVAISMWNNIRYPDEEDDLSDDQRRKMHLILGRRSDGSVRYLPMSGAFRDALSWFGGSDIATDITEVAKGQSTVGEKTSEAIAAPFEKVWQGSRPIPKLVFETTLGISSWPDMQHGTPIRDRYEHVTRAFSLDLFYKTLAGKPTKGMGRELFRKMGWYSFDPGESAYFQIKNRVNKLLKKEGELKSYTPTEKSGALYLFKQSLKHNQPELMERYLKKYYELGGTPSGIRGSMQFSAPTGSLPKKLRNKFYSSLTDKDKDMLNKASKWYKKTFNTKKFKK